jgi:hypothetical protein
MDFKPLRFIGEPVDVIFEKPPLLEKKPGAPDAFIWRGEQYRIEQVLTEWVDFKRRGRMARNMQPQHAAAAGRKGSWGVGVFYFRVRTENGRIFDIYYDRAPKDVNHRKGAWYLFQELDPADSEAPN